MRSNEVTEHAAGAITHLEAHEEAPMRRTDRRSGEGESGDWDEELERPAAKEDRYERVRRTADEALGKLAAELEQGRSEALVSYLATMSRFHRYSLHNVL